MDDVNVNYIDMSLNAMSKTIAKLCGFKQLVKEYTRITGTSSTTSDSILPNAAHNIVDFDVATSFSDHDMVVCIREVNH